MSKKLEERVALLEKEVKKLKGNNIRKINKKLTKGDEFELVGLKWKILDITEKGYICLANKLDDNKQFDSNINDWEPSDLRSYLNTEFYNKLADEVGEENIISFERNLLSLDGQTEYGTCEDKVSIISLDEYREYRKLIPNADYYWWTLTPDSTKCNDDSRWVRVVSRSGHVRGSRCDCSFGVRPFCIFSSAIFESEDK